MELQTNDDTMFLNTKPSKNVVGKIIISLLLGILPILLVSIMTFMDFPLNGLLTFGVGMVIGLTLIPFMLFITNTDKWVRKWYIWVAMSAVILIVFALPMFFKSSTGAGGIQGPMDENIRMEKGMY